MQAALCALRVIKKVPDLTDHFVTKAKNLLADRNHGVLLTAITLVIDMVQADPGLHQTVAVMLRTGWLDADRCPSAYAPGVSFKNLNLVRDAEY